MVNTVDGNELERSTVLQSCVLWDEVVPEPSDAEPDAVCQTQQAEQFVAGVIGGSDTVGLLPL